MKTNFLYTQGWSYNRGFTAMFTVTDTPTAPLLDTSRNDDDDDDDMGDDDGEDDDDDAEAKKNKGNGNKEWTR